MPIDLALECRQSPGDGVMLTAAVRDLHRCCPGKYRTAIACPWPDLWPHNPYLTELDHESPHTQTLEVHYPLVHQSSQRPYHFQHGYCRFLSEVLGERIEPTEWGGDIHLSADERIHPPPNHLDIGETRYWLVISGGKRDYTAKWPHPRFVEDVVRLTKREIRWVQVGEGGHHHPRIHGSLDLVGATSLRELIRLVYHADGVLCPVTLAMHLAAAVPTRSDRPPRRACVVLAGGRESPHWEAYPWHQYLHTVGQLPCCLAGGCWKSRTVPLGDGDAKDTDSLCERPIQVEPGHWVPQCQTMHSVDDIVRAVLGYYHGGAYSWPRTL